MELIPLWQQGGAELIIRELAREEIEILWEIDRSELTDGVYYFRKGTLVLESEQYDISGWSEGQAEACTPGLYECYDRGGTFFGAFEGTMIVGAAVLEGRFIGKSKDQLQLTFLHVGRDYRKRGLGKTLFRKSSEQAAKLGAARLYISATPSENSVDFYLHLGCVVTQEIDRKQFELEPDDIHLEYRIP